MSASPGSLESHSIVACCRRHRQCQCQLKPQVCSECWPAGLRRPAHRTCPFLLPGLLANGKRSALKRNTVLLPVCTASLRLEIHFGRGKKNAEHFVPAEKEERSWAGETSEPLNGLGGATHLLRLVSEEQNRVWERRGNSHRHRPLALQRLLCSNLSRSDRASTVSKLPLCPSRFLCRKPNAVKSSATSYGGRCVLLEAS